MNFPESSVSSSSIRSKERQLHFIFLFSFDDASIPRVADKLNYAWLSTIELVGQNGKCLQFTFMKLCRVHASYGVVITGV